MCADDRSLCADDAVSLCADDSFAMCADDSLSMCADDALTVWPKLTLDHFRILDLHLLLFYVVYWWSTSQKNWCLVGNEGMNMNEP